MKKLLIIPFLFLTTATLADTASEQKCYSNADFMKFIDDNKLVTVYNGSKNDIMYETMMSKDRHIFMVEYPKSKDGNAMAADKYCITNIIGDVTFNENAVEHLYNLLEKAKGKKV